ncbi:unnamed protein product [Brassica oleracea]
MIEAGVISEAVLPSSASFPFPSPAVIVPAPDTIKSAPRQTQDTNPLPGDAASGVDIDAQLPSTDLVMSTKNDIPQKDGSGDGDDADIKPNTNAPYDEDDEDLNENDDIEEECGIDDDNIPYLIIRQFDNVKRKRVTNKWDCKLKARVLMQINDKELFFSEECFYPSTRPHCSGLYAIQLQASNLLLLNCSSRCEEKQVAMVVDIDDGGQARTETRCNQTANMMDTSNL